jgi:hypothetical protein
VDYRSLHAGLSVCPEPWAAGRFVLSTCAGVQTGLLEAEASGFDRAGEDRTWMVDGTLGAAMQVRLIGPLTARVRARMAVPVVRDAFLFRGPDGQTEVIHRVSPVYGDVRLGLGLRFD